jgi:sporulation protein YlmC with PRC-barrel domain
MNIELNKNIECTDHVCGRTSYIIINPVTQQVTHLVVKDKSLPHHEHLIPIDWILSVTHSSVQLKCSRKELAQTEPFDRQQFIKSDTSSYPSIPHLMHPYVMPKRLLVPQESKRIPREALAIGRGAPVKARDGNAGQIEEFLIDPANGKITHLLLRTRHFLDGKQVPVPVSQVDHLERGTIYLKLDKHDLLSLPAIPVCRCYIWHDAPLSEPSGQGTKQKVRRETIVVKALIGHLSSRDGLTRQYARKSLVTIGKPAIPSLTALLNDHRHQVRWEAVKALGAIKDLSAINGLLTALNDDSFDVRWLAAEGLVSLGRQVLSPLLRTLVLQPDSVLLRDSAHHVLRSLIGQDKKNTIQPVLLALEDIDFSVKVRMAARSALKALGKL